jgi:hypothetical protein
MGSARTLIDASGMTQSFLLTTTDQASGGMAVTVHHRRGPLSARALFDPTSVRPRLALLPVPDGPVVVRDVLRARRPAARARAVIRLFIDYYRDRVAWMALLVTSVLLCYVGGLVMFWFHAEALGEGGPAISWYAHWMLDSTFGFLALTPALFLIMPLAAWAASAAATVVPRLTSWCYTVVAGVAFAFVTIPGPIAHNLLVGRGTWVANRVTDVIGNPAATLPPAHHYPVLADLTQQLGFGVPVYVALVAFSLPLVRLAVRPGYALATLRYDPNVDAVADRA